MNLFSAAVLLAAAPINAFQQPSSRGLSSLLLLASRDPRNEWRFDSYDSEPHESYTDRSVGSYYDDDDAYEGKSYRRRDDRPHRRDIYAEPDRFANARNDYNSIYDPQRRYSDDDYKYLNDWQTSRGRSNSRSSSNRWYDGTNINGFRGRGRSTQRDSYSTDAYAKGTASSDVSVKYNSQRYGNYEANPQQGQDNMPRYIDEKNYKYSQQQQQNLDANRYYDGSYYSRDRLGIECYDSYRKQPRFDNERYGRDKISRSDESRSFSNRDDRYERSYSDRFISQQQRMDDRVSSESSFSSYDSRSNDYNKRYDQGRLGTTGNYNSRSRNNMMIPRDRRDENRSYNQQDNTYYSNQPRRGNNFSYQSSRDNNQSKRSSAQMPFASFPSISSFMSPFPSMLRNMFAMPSILNEVSSRDVNSVLERARKMLSQDRMLQQRLGSIRDIRPPFSQNVMSNVFNGEKSTVVKAAFEVVGESGNIGVVTVEARDDDIVLLVVDVDGERIPLPLLDKRGKYDDGYDVVDAEIID